MERDSQKLTEFDIPDRLDIAYLQVQYENTIEDPVYQDFVHNHRRLFYKLLYAVKWLYLFHLQNVIDYDKDSCLTYPTKLLINYGDYDFIAQTKYGLFLNQFSQDVSSKFLPQWTPKKLRPYISWSQCGLLIEKNGEVKLQVEIKHLTKCDIIASHLFPCCLMDFLYRHYCVPT
jgi:hypothetical protein